MIRWALAIWVLLVGVLHAAHVSEHLPLDVYAEPALSGEPVATVDGGAAVEVLQTSDTAVQIAFGEGKEGWVDRRFILDEPSLQTQLDASRAELQSLQAQLEAAQQRIERMQEGQKDLLAARMAQQRLAVLRERVQDAIQQLSEAPGIAPALQREPPPSPPGVEYLPWVLAGAALLVGLAGGAFLVDYRIRQRFGGLRP